jgi:hypothetical protein
MAYDAANAVSQTADARFLSSPRGVKLAAKYADAQAASQHDGARNGHGSYLEEIFRPQNSGAVAETSSATARAQG